MSAGEGERLLRSETAQRQVVEQQLAILNALPACIALIDAEGMILHAEDRAEGPACVASGLVCEPCSIEHRIAFSGGRTKFFVERWQTFFDQTGAAQALGALPSRRARELLEAMLTDEDPSPRKRAAHGYARQPDADAEKVKRLFSDPILADAAAERLAERGDAAAIALLEPVPFHGNPSSSVMIDLSPDGHPERIPLMRRLLGVRFVQCARAPDRGKSGRDASRPRIDSDAHHAPHTFRFPYPRRRRRSARGPCMPARPSRP